MDKVKPDPQNLEKRTLSSVEEKIDSFSSQEKRVTGLEDEEFEKKYQQDLHTAQLQSLRDDISAKKNMTYRIFWMVVAWLVAILLMVALSGIGGINFDLSDAVLIALLGSTTVNVTAFFLVVTKYLFPAQTEKE